MKKLLIQIFTCSSCSKISRVPHVPEIPILEKFQFCGNSNFPEIPIIQKFQKIGTSITFDFIMIISMVLMLIISTIIAMVIVLFELNWIVEYLIDLRPKTLDKRVTTDTISILIVFIIENIFLVNEIERIINNKQKTRKNSRLQIDNNNNNN